MNKLKLIVFDCDGVITETAHLHYKAWKQIALQKLNVELNDSFLDKFRGLSRNDSVNLILKSFNMNMTNNEKQKFIDLKNDEYLKLINNPKNFSAITNVMEFIKEIKKTDIKIALASVSRNAPKLLDTLNILEWFDYIVNPADVQKHKPAPDIFIKAAQYFEIKPENCIGVEDAKIGVEAIKNANMFAIGVGNLKEVEKADVSFTYNQKISLDFIIKEWSNKNLLK